MSNSVEDCLCLTALSNTCVSSHVAFHSKDVSLYEYPKKSKEAVNKNILNYVDM